MPTATDPYRPTPIDQRAIWEHIAADPACAKVLAAQLDQLDKIPQTMPLPTAADYLAARRTNDRGRLDDHWRKTRPNFARLIVNRLLKGIDPHDADDRLLNWTFAFVHQPTWVISAHLPNNDLPLSGTGQLDLAACEAAGELAEMREVMLPWIDSNSQTLAETIVREIDRRVLTPVMASPEPSWWARLDAKRTDAKRLNNWTGVCAGSILAACLSLEATGIARPECRDRMIKLLNVFFDVAFSETGECEEGIGYWNYGVEFACLGMSRMTREQLNASFDLERLKRVAGYPERCHLAGNLFFAGNDSEPRASTTPGIIAWLGDLVGSDFLGWWSGYGDAGALRTVPHLLRFLATPRTDSATTRRAAPTHAPTRLLADQQAAIFQRPSKRGLFTFTVTGGTNDELHNHNDLGTFQLFLDERTIIPDLGAPQYVTDFFDDNVRYVKYMVAASSGHCCPSINGIEQRPGREAAGQVEAWDAETGEIALDLTSAYPPEARLKHWTRTTHVPADDAVAFLTDDFQLDGDGTIVHRIWFVDEPTVTEGGATLTVGDVVVQIEPRPDAVEVKAFKADDPRLMLRGFKGQTLHRVDLTYHVRAGVPLQVATRIHLT